MSIKSLCAAVVFTVVMGQAADAAVAKVYNLDFTLTDAGETYDDFETISQYDHWTPWGVSLGQTVRGKLFVHNDGYSDYVSLSLKGRVIFEASLDAYPGGGYGAMEYNSWNWTDFFWRGDAGYLMYTDDGSPYYEWADAELANIAPAPIPLPASAALLPVGIGALAMMRRRRVRG